MSSANDEKVVKPPQNPVIRKTFIDGEMRCVFSARPKKMPITKLPMMLTANVPQGKGRDRYDVGQFSGQEAQACADKAAEACNNHRFEHIDRVFMLSGWRNKFDAIARRTSVCPAPPGSLAYYLDFEEIRIGVPLFRRDPAGSVR